ncbi:hypothetical protein ACWCRD_03160 [Streptomyces sp. NPDC002092]
MAHTFDTLVQLEQAAEQARARLDQPGTDRDSTWRAWRDAAEAFQAAVTEYAAEGESRVEVEMRVKKAVRHPEAAES